MTERAVLPIHPEAWVQFHYSFSSSGRCRQVHEQGHRFRSNAFFSNRQPLNKLELITHNSSLVLLPLFGSPSCTPTVIISLTTPTGVSTAT